MKLSLNIICAPGVHCGTCRQLQAGREWRRQLSAAYDADRVDFACPQNRPWIGPGEPGDEAPVPLSEIEAQIDRCHRCVPVEPCELRPLPDCKRKARLSGGFVCPNPSS